MRLPLWLLCLSLFVLVTSCDDSQTPTVPADNNGDIIGGYDPETGSLEFQVDTGSGRFDLKLLARNLHFDADSQQLSADVSIRNDDARQVPGPAVIQVLDFVPRVVRPINVVCSTQPGPVEICFFDHSGTYGDDGVLSPGETSDSVRWTFHDPQAQSFSFRARVAFNPEPSAVISGRVFMDRNRNGVQDRGEEGIPSVLVEFRTDSTVVAVTSNAQGFVRFAVQEPGLYVVHKPLLPGFEPTTPQDLQVMIVRDPEGNLSSFENAHFGCVRVEPNDLFDIQGHIFLDGNRNGQFDAGERGLPGVRLTAFGLECAADDSNFAMVFSQRGGRYAINRHSVGCVLPWVVQRVAVPGMINTTPSEVVLHMPPRDGIPLFTVDFGFAPPDSSDPQGHLIIQGSVFVDRNGNGIIDRGERRVRGVQLTLLSPCETFVPILAHTGPFGGYRFESLETGFCPIDGVLQALPQFENTTPNPFMFMPPLPGPGHHVFRVDFGVR